MDTTSYSHAKCSLQATTLHALTRRIGHCLIITVVRQGYCGALTYLPRYGLSCRPASRIQSPVIYMAHLVCDDKVLLDPDPVNPNRMEFA